ncbi:hypothetical protein DQ04_01251000 [Trypanosoma grayi]|uniref:hypothetical protein n=1 Tax=Trypanosoma grayi TaxID=71804 RepID=UPI0004F43841|nr:hypothetical protein DQ04_01251000 [Trypanosoma grayi]KEG13027.1 hypothetical protein DQ04_01251000 [Trypanosoma grayi]
MIFDRLPMTLPLSQDNVLEDALENVLANSHSLLNNTRRLSNPESDSGVALLKHALYGTQTPRAAAPQVDNSEIIPAIGALHTQLEECRDLLRQVDSERRLYREKTVQLQRALDEEHHGQETLRNQIVGSQDELRKAQRKAIEVQQRLREMEEAMDTATEEQMRLRRFLRSMPMNKERALTLVPDRRFEEAFRDKMSAIHYKRRYERARQLYQQRSEMAEGKQMAMEDTYTAEGADLPSLSLTGAQGLAALALPDVSSLANSTNNLSTSQWVSLRSVRDTLTFPFLLPFSHTTARDDYINTQVQRSTQKDSLARLREGAFRMCHRLKHVQDSGLHSMYGVLLEILRTHTSTSASMLVNPKKTFESVLEKMQHALREMLFEIVDLVNSAVMQIANREPRVAVKQAVAKHDVGCSVYLGSTFDMRLADIEAKLEAQRRKSAASESDLLAGTLNARNSGTMMRSKALLTLEQLLSLHKAFCTVAQAANSTCDNAAPELKDMFEELALAATDTALDDSRYETKVAEAVEADVRHAERLAASAQRAATVLSASGTKKRLPSAVAASASRAKSKQKQQLLSQTLPAPSVSLTESQQLIEAFKAVQPTASIGGALLPKRLSNTKDLESFGVTSSSLSKGCDESEATATRAVTEHRREGTLSKTCSVTKSGARTSSSAGVILPQPTRTSLRGDVKPMNMRVATFNNINLPQFMDNVGAPHPLHASKQTRK